jgi:dihydrofolate synthase/folylpolyglutamate synthase
MEICMDINQKYQQALDYLYSFVDYSLTRNFRYAAEKFDLARMDNLLALINHPEKKYPVIHVAGTKGKGSTSALIASALEAGGYKVGFYSSPHLVEFTERLQINKTEISKAQFCDLVDGIKPYVKQIQELTTFEISTAIAFWYFAHQKADFVVAEVGLGGRLDATNVVDPLVSIITSISYDHINVLGHTLTDIAREKAGIIKSKRPVVIAPQMEEAQEVFISVAKEKDSILTQVGCDYLFAPGTHSLNNQNFLVWPARDQKLADEYADTGGRSDWEPTRLTIPLLGYHQVENAATAYAAIQVIKDCGINIPEKAIKEGFANVKWPGRFEVLQRNPPIIIDSAHNRDSALKLRLTIDDYLSGIPVILIFGASEDKDIEGMFQELLPRVREVIATRSVHPRAIEPEKLVEICHRYGRKAKSVIPLDQALKTAIKSAEGECAVIVAGSIFVSAGIREIWFGSKFGNNGFLLEKTKVETSKKKK